MQSKDPLSLELKIACEIYKQNKKGNLIGHQRLVDKFKEYASKKRISDGIDTLFDWSLIRASWVEGIGVLYISDETKPLIKRLYKKYYKRRLKNSKNYNKGQFIGSYKKK
jgi:hypothetical protein